MAAPWSPKVCGTASREELVGQGRGGVEAPPGARDRRARRSGASPADCRSVRPRIQTWTRSPCASPGPSSTIAAVERERREAAQEPAGAGVPHRAAVDRDEQVRALVARGRRRPGQAQHHGRGAGAGRHARRGVPGRQDEDAGQRPQPGGAGHRRGRRSGATRARRPSSPPGPGSAPGPRPRAPARAAPAPTARPARSASDARRSVGRDGAELVRADPASPARRWPSGSTGSGPGPGSPA